VTRTSNNRVISRRVNSIIACCHSMKRCALAARAFRSQQRHSALIVMRCQQTLDCEVYRCRDGLENPLEDMSFIKQQLEQISTIARCEYSDSCQVSVVAFSQHTRPGHLHKLSACLSWILLREQSATFNVGNPARSSQIFFHYPAKVTETFYAHRRVFYQLELIIIKIVWPEKTNLLNFEKF